MEIGIFARTFAGQTVEEILDQVVAHGIHHIQFNTLCLGLPDMPDALEPAACERVAQALAARNIQMASLSGTYNMIHPDPGQRADGMRQLGVLAANASAFGTDLLTLCTGTRDTESMWRAHPNNDTPEAWQDLLAEMERAVAVAEEHNVRLGIEPEVSNVVSSPRKARELLDTIRSDRLVIVMDGANVFPKGTIHRQEEILDEAFSLLGDRIGLAHAKDLSHDGEAGHEAAGTGLLDYDHYLKCLHQSGYRGALVLHSLTPDQVPGCVSFLRQKLEALG